MKCCVCLVHDGSLCISYLRQLFLYVNISILIAVIIMCLDQVEDVLMVTRPLDQAQAPKSVFYDRN